jgi:hypothetical protein
MSTLVDACCAGGAEEDEEEAAAEEEVMDDVEEVSIEACCFLMELFLLPLARTGGCCWCSVSSIERRRRPIVFRSKVRAGVTNLP